jgi:UDP:flavonoid glycosyltransferase YjiC (YdhE family)
LTAAVPMVAVPLFVDQPRNAARIEELKAGVRVDEKG